MIFLHITCGDHEWGFEVRDGFIPAVGDIITLWHAPPDEEANECVDAVVTKRQWNFASDFAEWNTVELTVRLKEPIPNGHIADSTEWPARDESKRRQQHAEELAAILRRCDRDKDSQQPPQ